MNITPNEIENIEEAGMLDGSAVKIIKTKGGFHIAVGRLKNKLKDDVLSAGSHPAIVKFNLEKMYPQFQPSMLKSEGAIDNTVVEKHSHFLPEELRKSGHDIYSVQNDKNVEFQITKQNVKVYSVNGSLDEGTMLIDPVKTPKEFVRSLSGAVTEKAIACGAEKIKIKEK